MKGILVFICFLLLAAGNLLAQPQIIELDVAGLSLNKVLVKLSERYGFQLAFDDRLLSSYKISASRRFETLEETLSYLLKDLPLTLEKSGDVFMIVPHKEPKIIVKPVVRAAGQVVEAGSNEPLPFSNILINNKQVLSDQNGSFTFFASADTSLNMRISHLGYFIYDTVFTSGFNRLFYLHPSVARIGEVTVTGGVIEKSTLIGDKPGKIKLNHTIAPYLPGYGDNPVFNLLRLMPGVLASGEHAADLLIWGSYESHSKVDFDGFTLFGLKNFNDNIGAVNPLVLKDVEVMKGAYEAKYGDRVGGIVNISGKNGNLTQPSFTFNINNTTVNSLVEVPVTSRSSLLAAYRQTYYELYDPTKLSPIPRKNKDSESQGFTLTPDYQFKDANLKYSFHDRQTDVAISLYGGGDRFEYDMEQVLTFNRITRNETEINRQAGGSAIMLRTLENGNSLKLNLNFSRLWNTSDEINKSYNLRSGRERILKTGNGKNNVGQLTLSGESKWNFADGHSMEAGAGMAASKVLFYRQLFSEELINTTNISRRLFGYIQDNLPLGDKLNLKAGIRASYLPALEKIYIEPKFSASLGITEKWKVNFAWGVYHQFIAKTSLVDSTLNIYYFWANADNLSIPVLKGRHTVGGFTYNQNGFTASIEGYYKKTVGISRFINGTNHVARGFYSGDSRSYGLDFYLKKEYKNNVAWVSYTLSKTEEHFPYFGRDVYRAAPQDQRHEIKFAGILNFKSFYISADYVHGSGFEKFIITNEEGIGYIPAYNRLDVALIYKFKPGKINCETGLSILNVLNTENIKLSNLRRVATGVGNPLDVYAESVPFTPTLFLKIRL